MGAYLAIRWYLKDIWISRSYLVINPVMRPSCSSCKRWQISLTVLYNFCGPQQLLFMVIMESILLNSRKIFQRFIIFRYHWSVILLKCSCHNLQAFLSDSVYNWKRMWTSVFQQAAIEIVSTLITGWMWYSERHAFSTIMPRLTTVSGCYRHCL